MKQAQPVVHRPVCIPEEAMREMAKFFMRTSIPRILTDMKKKGGKSKCIN